MRALPCENSIIKEITEKVKTATAGMTKMRDFAEMGKMFEESEKLCNPEIGEVLPGEGRVVYSVAAKAGLFYDVLTEESGDEIKDDYQLMSYIKSLAEAKREYGKIRDALKSAEETGYGIVTPTVNELSLSEPELVKRGGSYGVKLKATAPSLHVMKVDVSAEVNPIVGTEKQGEELVNYLMKEFESNPQGIWDTNMFGKSLRDLMEESLSGKIKAMPEGRAQQDVQNAGQDRQRRRRRDHLHPSLTRVKTSRKEIRKNRSKGRFFHGENSSIFETFRTRKGLRLFPPCGKL